MREGGQPDRVERLLDPFGNPATSEHQPARAAVDAGGDVEVLQHGQLLEHRGGLEGPPDPEADDLVRRHREQVSIAEHGFAARTHEAGERIDEGRLARSVGSDQEVQASLQERHVDVVDRREPVEVDGQAADLEVVLAQERSGHASASVSTAPTSRRAAPIGFDDLARRGGRSDRSDRSLDHSEAAPPGRSRMTTMNSAPWK